MSADDVLDSDLLLCTRDRAARVGVNGEFITSERPCRLLAGEMAGGFIRSHMSYWVNKEKIAAMAHGEFVLCDGTRIPISRNWRVAAREAFLASRE